MSDSSTGPPQPPQPPRPAAPAPGWYADAAMPSVERWWDGQAWTAYTRPAPPAYPPPMYRSYASQWDPAQWDRPVSAGNGYSTAGIICGAIAFIFFPIVLGPVGLVLGAVARSHGERRANIAIVVSAVGLVVGVVLGAVVVHSLA